MKAFLLLLVLGLVFAQHPDPTKWRTLNGYGNNIQNPTWGSAGIPLKRMVAAYYGDGISSDRLSVKGGPLPSPRFISNTVHAAPPSGVQPVNIRGLTGFLTYWGQFIAHDIDLTGGPAGSAIPLEPINIEVPKGDAFFDPQSTGTQVITIDRSVFDPTSGNSTSNPRNQLNLVSSYLDGSHVYGTDNATASFLRTFSGGLLKTTMLNGLELPPINTANLPVEDNANHYNTSQLYLLGDVRGNENPALTALHTLFIREHNRRARELATLNPTWTDEELYQEARRWVIAVIQHVTFDEYLPVTIGDAANNYYGYDPTVDASMYTEFSTGAFRYGHSEVETYIYRLNSTGGEIPEGNLRVRDNYYNSPVSIGQVGIEPILRGLAGVKQNAVDIYFVDELRNYLFGNPGQGGFDLASVNIQRGREHGIPSLNQLRRDYGLVPYNSFEEMNSDPNVYQKLYAAYKDIEDCDVYTCGLAEYHDLANLGDTFVNVVSDQYHRFRDGDRFWFEVDGYLDPADLAAIKNSTLKDVIVRNTPIPSDELQCFVFGGPDGCGKAIPPVPPGAYPKYDYIVKLALKTPAHPYFGKGHPYAFTLNDQQGPTLNFVRGNTYYFRVESSCAHAFVFLLTPDVNGTVLGPVPPAGAGDGDVNFDGALPNHGCIDYVNEIALVIDYDTPDYFYYQCDFHNMLMGGNILITGPISAPVGAGIALQPVLLLAVIALLALLL
jgi:hypothetical protein